MATTPRPTHFDLTQAFTARMAKVVGAAGAGETLSVEDAKFLGRLGVEFRMGASTSMLRIVLGMEA